MSSIFLVMTLLFAVGYSANGDCDVFFSGHPQDVYARIGDVVNFTCDIANDMFLSRDFTQYRTNGSVVIQITANEPNTEARGFTRVGFNVLRINGVRAEHAGIYGCSATPDRFPCDGDTKIYSMNATLSIIGPPEINRPASTVFSAPTTSELKLSLLITGTSPTVQVYRIGESGNMVEVLTATDSRFQHGIVGTEFQMTISRLSRADAGDYLIVATNDFGDSRINVTISPIGPDPPVVDTRDIVLSEYDAPLSVACSVQNDATVDSTVTFVWTDMNNDTITRGTTYNIMSSGSTSTLTINSFAKNSTRELTCSATNLRGSDSKTTMLFGPPPAISGQPRITGMGRSRTVTWDRPPTAGEMEPIMRYEIRLNIADTAMIIHEDSHDVPQNHTSASYTLENLNPNSYEVRVTPVSIVGEVVVEGVESQEGPFVVDEEESNHVIAIVVGAVAGVAILVAIGAAIGIFFLCFYYPHRRQLQSQQQTWSREDVKTDGPIQNEYTSLTLRPNSNFPASPGMSSPTSSNFLADIDPKWEFPRENIKLTDALCEGQFTVLYRGIATGIKEKPVDIAVKTVRDDATEEDVKALAAEMELLSSIGPHENIVSMIRVCTVGKPMYMVMEYMCHGDLLGFLRASRGHHGRYTVSPGLGYQPPAINLYPRDLLNIGAKIANGMRYLADRKLVHRALCAKNVLVGSNMSIKIYNMGSFDMTFESRDYITKWLAPETLFDQTATTYSDVWSFGVTLWELVTVGGSPYGEIQPEDLYSQLMNGMRMPCPQHCAQEIHTLMLDCWRRNPVDRPHFSVIHEKLEDLAASKISLLDFQNYDVYVYSQFEEPVALSTVL